MDIKVVVLTDNTSIITRLSELKSPDGESLCFLMSYPFLLENQVDEEGKTNIRFSAYNPYIQDNEIRLGFGGCRHIAEPKNFIKEKYIEVVSPFDPVWAERATASMNQEQQEIEE